ncbi:MAG: MgtC/SapB family protein [Croceibacterium sp.]
MQQSRDLILDASFTLPLLAAVAAGLLIGIERGWRQRDEPDGTRVAGVRTFTLIGGSGGLMAIVARTVSPLVAAVVVAGMVVGLLIAFLRPPADPKQRDATTMIAAFGALLLGLLAGAGQPALAVAGAALATLVLATREQTHKLVGALSAQEVQSLARFAVLAGAVLPFLPDKRMGPYDAWNPFQLWLVVVFVTGFSLVGYVANRVIGEKKGTIATALIGGAYSSTAVTAALASRLHDGEPGPLTTGIALATAVMYLRVALLTFLLAPTAALPLAVLLAPAAVVAWLASAVAWHFDSRAVGTKQHAPGKPFHLLPALAFLLAVAGAALLVRWAQADIGETAGAWGLFLAGSFDVDTAIVTLASLPAGAIGQHLAALALAGTAAVNMAFKIGVAIANARWSGGRNAALALLASEVVLVATLAVGLITL